MILVDKYVPFSAHHKRSKRKLPCYVRNLLNKRNHARKKFRLGSHSALSHNKQLHSRSKAALRKCFNDDEKQILSCRNNKRFYSFVN